MQKIVDLSKQEQVRRGRMRTALASFNSEVFRIEDAYVAELADIFQKMADDLKTLAKQEPLAKICVRWVNEVNEVTPHNVERRLVYLRFRAISKE